MSAGDVPFTGLGSGGGGGVPTSRNINTTSPLAGGGDLSADRTLSIDTSGLVPTSRTVSAGTGLSGGGDLSSNRTLALAALSPSPAGSYTNPSVTVNDKGQITAISNGTAGLGHGQTLCQAFESGGNIAQWVVYPTITGTVTYAQFGSSYPVGGADFPILRSKTGGTYDVTFIYDVDTNILVTPRIKSAGGSWSSGTPITLDLNDTSRTISVTLAAGESLGMHCAPVGGGSVGVSYWELFV